MKGLTNKDIDLFQSLTLDNGELSLRYDYYIGNQWTIEGVETRSGWRAVDLPFLANQRHYSGPVTNLVKDAVTTMTSFLSGENEAKYSSLITENSTLNNILNYYNINSLVQEVYELCLLYDECYLSLKQNKLGDYYFSVHSPREIGQISDKKYVRVIEEPTDILEKKVFQYHVYDILENGQCLITVYRNDKYIEEYIIPFFPYYKFSLTTNYLTKSLFKLQDRVNVLEGKILDSIKYNSDPLTVIKVQNTKKDITYRTGPGAILQMPENGSVERITGSDVDGNVLAYLNTLKDDFYKMSQLFGYKSSLVGGQVITGVGLTYRQADTYNFAEKIRQGFKLEVLRLFNYYYKITNLEIFNVKHIELAPLRGEKFKEEEYRREQYKTIREKLETVSMIMSSLSMTKEEAEAYLNNELM